jgi:predicted Zn-dependent protease
LCLQTILLLPSALLAQSPALNQILPRGANALHALVNLDAPPAVTVLEPAHYSMKAAQRVPLKYNVALIGSRGIGSGVNFYTMQQEQAMGKQLADEIEAQAQIVTDPEITEFINRLGQQLVRNSDARVPFTIKVLANDEINAFALPGGYLYVNSGLILAADNQAELAGVMGHEIAHVAARHATRTATKSQLWNMASFSLVFVGGPTGMALRQVANIALPMTLLKFSRDAEREADLLGMQYEYAAGYDPAAFVAFFEKLSRHEAGHGRVAKAFATHPMNGERVRRAQQTINTMLPEHDQYVVTTSDFDEVKARLQQIMSGKMMVKK